MPYLRATDSPPRYQFEDSSGTLYSSQVFNCGPTCVTKIAQYYLDRWFGIETNRRLIAGQGPFNVNGETVYGAPAGMPTNAWQQAAMLRARGVPCSVVGITDVEQLKTLVRGGRRPIILGLNFARVHDDVAGHTFQGWHAIAVLDYLETVAGDDFVYNDPNFSPSAAGPRPDWTGGKRRMSVSEMSWALADPEVNWAIVPLMPKSAPPVTLTEAQEMAILSNVKVATGRYFDVKAGVQLRKGPGTGYPRHWLTDSVERFWLIGFTPNGWAVASRTKSSTGLFFVPPAH